jgi:dTDP-glucose pyrophosphorylase
MTGDEICSMNFWGFQPGFFETLEDKFVAFLKAKGEKLQSEWYIPDVIQDAINAGETRVKLLSSNSQWFGVTYPDDRAAVVTNLETMHQAGKYPARLWS